MSMLVALILDMVVTLVPTVYLSPPAVGRYIFKKQTWKKRDSKLFARRFAGMSRITDDEADAFVMLVPFFEPDQQDRMGVARYYEYEEVESAGWQRKAKH